jgi:hypothetical protein
MSKKREDEILLEWKDFDSKINDKVKERLLTRSEYDSCVNSLLCSFMNVNMANIVSDYSIIIDHNNALQLSKITHIWQWNNPINLCSVWCDGLAGVFLDFTEIKIIFDFENPEYLDVYNDPYGAWRKSIETIRLVAACNTLTVQYMIPRQKYEEKYEDGAYIASKKLLYGSPVTALDYIELMIKICHKTLKFERSHNRFLTDIEIKNIEVSSQLDVVIYLDMNCV